MNSTDKAKRINSLMKHLRDDCNINIKGSKEKLQLTQYGYYHGYKGYRFIKKRTNTIEYTEFSQIVAVIEYDNSLKRIFYPTLMFVEMAIKNFTLAEIVPGMKDCSIDSIYKTKMNDDLYNKALRLKRLKLKDKLHSTLSNSYKNSNIMVSHFYNRGQEVPIWGIFEIMTLGDFADFLQSLNRDARGKITKSLFMSVSFDTNFQLLSNALFTIKALRNAIAHNNISDYFVLMICLLKHVQYPDTMLINFLREYEECINNLYKVLPLPMYNKIVETGIIGKLDKIKDYVKK